MALDPSFWDEPQPPPPIVVINDFDQLELRIAAARQESLLKQKLIDEYSKRPEVAPPVDTGRRRSMMDIGKDLFPIQKMPEPTGASLYYFKDDPDEDPDAP